MKKLELLRLDRTMEDALLPDLIEVYRSVFAEAPYFETYSREETADMFRAYLDAGIVVTAMDAKRVVGFVCVQQAHTAPADVVSFLEEAYAAGELPCNVVATWYLSELGVLAPYRMHGLGYSLTREGMHRVQTCGGENIVTRTAFAHSNSRHLFERLGYVPFGEQDVSLTDQVLQNGSQSDRRVYLHTRI